MAVHSVRRKKERRLAAGHQDPETMGMLGAAWDRRYQESGKTLHLRASPEMYRSAFQGDPKDYHTGINAAAKSLFLGESQEAERLAANVLPLVKAASDGNDFWAGCTSGEIYLLQRKLNSAAAQYQKSSTIILPGLATTAGLMSNS